MKSNYDLVVIGGGMSGVSAAVTSAKKGLRVLLIEQTAMLGGVGVSGLITMMMTSRYNFFGLGKEFINRLISKGFARKIENPAVKGYDYYPFDAEGMKRELEALLEESGAEFLLHTKVIAVKKFGRNIKRLVLCGVQGQFEVSAKFYIDASGDGIVCKFSGESVLYGDENHNTQAPTMMAYYSGIDFEKYDEFLKQFENGERAAKINMIHSLVPKAVEDGVLSECDFHHPGIFQISGNVGVMNAGHVYGADCSTSKGITDATVKGRKMAKEYFDFYKKYIPGFENAYMTNTGSALALRETGRVVGRYVTTFEDKTNYRKFDDAIMRFDGGAVSDLHASSSDKKAYDEYVKLFSNRESVLSDDFAHLPLRSFLPLKTDNLLVVGRCMSADRKVLGQLRIMGYCFMMGQAAGEICAESFYSNVNFAKVDVKKVQQALKEQGVPTV